MSDPVEIICAERYDIWDDEEREVVRRELSALRDAGWKVVRTETVDTGPDLHEVVIEEWVP